MMITTITMICLLHRWLGHPAMIPMAPQADMALTALEIAQNILASTENHFSAEVRLLRYIYIIYIP